jgi:hypothetical protein
MGIKDYPDWSPSQQTVGQIPNGPNDNISTTVSGSQLLVNASPGNPTYLWGVDIYIKAPHAADVVQIQTNGASCAEVYVAQDSSVSIELDGYAATADVFGMTLGGSTATVTLRFSS